MLLKKALGNAEKYLDRKKMPGRLKWSEEYDLGYDYLECGICKLGCEEGCPELSKYLCRLDFVLADIMGMKLKRTMTLAEGYEKCDFRYSRK